MHSKKYKKHSFRNKSPHYPCTSRYYYIYVYKCHFRKRLHLYNGPDS